MIPVRRLVYWFTILASTLFVMCSLFQYTSSIKWMLNCICRSMQGDGSSNRESDATHDSPLVQVARALCNFVGLKAPEQKRKPGHQSPAGINLHMMIVVQKARSTDWQEMHKLEMDAGQVNELACPLYVENQGTRAPHVHKEVIFLKKKGKRQNI